MHCETSLFCTVSGTSPISSWVPFEFSIGFPLVLLRPRGGFLEFCDFPKNKMHRQCIENFETVAIREATEPNLFSTKSAVPAGAWKVARERPIGKKVIYLKNTYIKNLDLYSTFGGGI
jgi:hypothetical protein